MPKIYRATWHLHTPTLPCHIIMYIIFFFLPLASASLGTHLYYSLLACLYVLYVCMAMSSPPSPSPPCDLELSITSARDLKNVNWKHGDLCAYAVAWVDEESKVATRVDASGDTNPSWVNQNFIIPVRKPIWEARLSIEIYHYHYHDKDKDKDKDKANREKALVGAVSIPVAEIVDAGGCDEALDYSLKLKRPSGRPQGKVDFSVRVRERRYMSPQPAPGSGSGSIYPVVSPRSDGIPSYTYPPSNYPYVPTPTSCYPPSQPYTNVIGQAYPGYNTQPYAAPTPAPYPTYNNTSPPPYAYVPRPPPPPPSSSSSSYGSASAPQMLGSCGYPQEALPPSKKGPLTSSTTASPFGGMGTGLAIGALAGAVGGLALDEFVHHEEKEAAERQADEDADRYAELDAARDDDYGGDDYSYDDGF